VIGTTRHQSRRIDRQLRGRSARLGDPGSSKFFVSFEDALMRLFTSPRITVFLQRFRPPEGEPIAAKVLNKSIETAQKRVEQRNYTMRKHTLEYDDVMNKQREEIYSFRNEVLRSPQTDAIAEEILENVCSQMSQKFFVSRNMEGGWNPEGYRQWLMTHFPLTFETNAFDNDYLSLADIEKHACDKVVSTFKHKLSHEAESIQKVQALMPDSPHLMPPEKILAEVIRNLLIRNIDRLWQEHLLHIDHLRTEVHLRAIGQKDPLLEFKHEAFLLFDSFSLNLKLEIAHALFKFEMVVPKPEAPKRVEFPKRSLPAPAPSPVHRTNLSLIPNLNDLFSSDETDSDDVLSKK
jgi:preprotein translocase subunit SecA